MCRSPAASHLMYVVHWDLYHFCVLFLRYWKTADTDMFFEPWCGFQGCKNRVQSVSWPEVIEDVPIRVLIALLAIAVFVSLLCLCVVFCLLFLVVSSNAINCLERLVSKMTYYDDDDEIAYFTMRWRTRASLSTAPKTWDNTDKDSKNRKQSH